MRSLLPSRSSRSAFTLIEATLAVAIVAIMIGAGLSAVTQSQRSRRLAEEMSKARGLAAILLEEVGALAYCDPQEPTRPLGPDTYEDVQDRFTFDDIDDYDGLMVTPITDKDATWLTDEQWVANFTVTWIVSDDPGTAQLQETNLKRIRVVLSHAGRDVYSGSIVKSKGWEALQ